MSKVCIQSYILSAVLQEMLFDVIQVHLFVLRLGRRSCCTQVLMRILSQQFTSCMIPFTRQRTFAVTTLMSSILPG